MCLSTALAYGLLADRVLKPHVIGIDDDVIDDEFDTVHFGRDPLGQFLADVVIHDAAEHDSIDRDGNGKIERMQLRIPAERSQDLGLTMRIADLPIYSIMRSCVVRYVGRDSAERYCDTTGENQLENELFHEITQEC